VLLNLVLNAIEAMSRVDERARVLTIRAARTTLDKQPAIAITVADTGAGFAQDSADQMFDAFYSTKTGGMGMGLRISRTIAEGYGGRVSARRNAGGGATFSLVLPIKSRAA
jgi:C4-dicarboxylate-specific signal transduction histidine kinase